jgi:hypothetical protein
MLIYLDQTALIDLGWNTRNSAEFRQRLNQSLVTGSIRFVLTWWHLIESSYGDDAGLCGELGDFIQSLNCRWLPERYHLLQYDVAEDFYTFARIPYEPRPRIVDWTGLLALFEALRTPGSVPFKGSIRDFITLWRNLRLERGDEAEQVFRKAGERQLRLRQTHKSGKITDAAKAVAQDKLLQSAMPSTTPAGLAFGTGLRSDYFRQTVPSRIRGIALETAISEFEWTMKKSGAARNQLIDGFHLVTACPHVDMIVSRDNFFRAVYPTLERTGFVRAKLAPSSDLIKLINEGSDRQPC